MKHMLIAMAWAAGLFAAAFAQAQDALEADLVLTGGKVWTVDTNRPHAAAVAIHQSRILAVGSDDEVTRLIGPKTKVIKLKGRGVLPGFIDSHIHLLSAGRRLSEVALKDADDEAEFGRRLKEFDKRLPHGRWMTGGEWDHDRALGGKLPDAALIDKYVVDRPVFLNRYDGHMAVCNTEALRLAGITADTKDPAGGVIYRKPGTHEPTGLLRDRAMDLVSRLVPPLSDDEIVEGVRAALPEIRAAGVTTVEDMAGHDRETQRKLFLLYQKLAREGQLTVRVNLRWPLEQWQDALEFKAHAQTDNDWICVSGVKRFMDGSLGSSTAKMYEPYLNEPDSTGVFVTPPSRMASPRTAVRSRSYALDLLHSPAILEKGRVQPTNCDKGTRSTLAIKRRFKMAMFRSPRSTEPMNVRCSEQRSAKFACVSDRSSRRSRIRAPRSLKNFRSSRFICLTTILP